MEGGRVKDGGCFVGGEGGVEKVPLSLERHLQIGGNGRYGLVTTKGLGEDVGLKNLKGCGDVYGLHCKCKGLTLLELICGY